MADRPKFYITTPIYYPSGNSSISKRNINGTKFKFDTRN